ncbi:MAG: glutamine synthetase [Paracoccaceae bacterium]|jgi:glutamine synthetase
MRPVKDGTLAQRGLLNAETCAQADELLASVAASDLETVRVMFVDQHGILRGKTLVATALPSAFNGGIAVPSTLLLKDTSHRTVFPVWSKDIGITSGPMQGANDVLLVPNPASFRVLPWSPHSAWLLCDVVFRDGRPIPFSSRTVLQNSIDRLADYGFSAKMGLEVEFNVFERTDTTINHADTTMPGTPPETSAFAHGFQFLTETRYGASEPLLDRLRRTAQQMDLPVRSVEIEMGPGQFEFTFDPADPMQHADNMVMFRTMVKQVCASMGLHASFMAKPRIANVVANGWHIHQSLNDIKTDRNVFVPETGDILTAEAEGWIAGLLSHASESSLLIAPTVNSYKRYQPYQLAPNRIQWGQDNRGAMVRALMMPGDAASRVENRAPDTTANPYFAFASQLICGLHGIVSGLVVPPPTHSPYDSDAPELPGSLMVAIDAFDGSDLYRQVLGDDCVNYLVKLKRFEWDRYLSAISEWEQAEYFSLF